MRQKKKKTTTNMDFHSAMEVFAEAWAVAKTRAALEACRGEKVSLWQVFRDRQTVGMLTGHTEGDPRQDGPPRPGTTRGDDAHVLWTQSLQTTHRLTTGQWEGKGGASRGRGVDRVRSQRGGREDNRDIIINSHHQVGHVGDLMLVMVVVSWI